MTSGSPVEVAEPISPELVLVASPQAARTARERLVDRLRPLPSQRAATPRSPLTATAEPVPEPG